ncbi:MAG TPA: 50S ribosomal protein L10 [Firmicutes bacterium]|nr:50S ribosomal protein L10 [Bacillota bacterium]
MSENRKKKQLVIDETISRFRESNGVVITDYQGLDVEQINLLRRELEKTGASYKVIKNTLSKRVLDEMNINGDVKVYFTGVTGLVFCADYISSIKVLAKFAKENENLKIKGGYIENKHCSLAQIKELSSIGSREELLQKLVSVLNNPVSKLVNQLAKPIKDIVYVTKAVSDSKK